MYAVVSDIHANLAAWQAVLADIDRQGIGRIICLGDIVGYGPDPGACLTLARERCAFALKGNHDVAVLYEPLGFNQPARLAALWTKRQLEPRWFSLPTRRRNWEFLRRAPERWQEGTDLFVHGSPRDPVMEYIEEGDLADFSLVGGEKMQQIFAMFAGRCFVGHTHRPGIFTADLRFRKPAEIDQRWQEENVKAIINVGSVGQPRDGDPRACYVTVDGPCVRFHRVPYDVAETIRRIHAIPELDALLGDRLRDGR